MCRHRTAYITGLRGSSPMLIPCPRYWGFLEMQKTEGKPLADGRWWYGTSGTVGGQFGRGKRGSGILGPFRLPRNADTHQCSILSMLDLYTATWGTGSVEESSLAGHSPRTCLSSRREG